MANLQNLLDKLANPDPFPPALPLIHVSKGGINTFQQIISDTKLSVCECKVFSPQHLLYFSYGNVFYDTGNCPTWKEISLPVCFLLKPSILSQITYYFPYDTGAAKFNKYGKHSQLLSTNFDKYRVNGYDRNMARKLIYYIYGSNQNYRRGEVNANLEQSLIDNCQDLLDFLRDRIDGCDERQYTIECQSQQDIFLRDNLEWIAYPQDYTYTPNNSTWHQVFMNLFEQMEFDPPTHYCYEWTKNFNPRKILGEIRAKANDFIKTKYDPPT